MRIRKLLTLALIPLLMGFAFPLGVIAQVLDNEAATLTVNSMEEIPDIAINSEISDQVVVIYKDDANISDLSLSTSQVKAGESLNSQVDLIEVSDSSKTEQLIRQLKENPNVLAVDRNCYLTTSALPNDPDLDTAWQFEAIHADKTWNQVDNRDTVVVAVIDSGVNTQHPDLEEKILTGFDYVDGTTAMKDLAGHGTMVSGCIAATADNEIGFAGVTGNANIKILPYRVGGRQAGDMQLDVGYICAALYDAATREDVRVINMSFGGYGVTSVLRVAIENAASAGKVLVASAGNEGGNDEYQGEMAIPASYNNVISVAATTIDNQRAAFSQYNSLVDLCAPGQAVYTTTTEGDYAAVNGTSFSSPIVAGACAVLIAKNPELTAQEVETTLKETALDLGDPGRDDYFGYGMIQLDSALNAVAPYTPLAIDGFTTDQSGTITAGRTLNLETTVSGGSEPYSYSFYYDLNGQTSIIQDYSNENRAAFTPFEEGIYTLWTQVLDNQGELVKKSIDNIVVESPETVSVSYRTHVENQGWQAYVQDGQLSGTVGQALRLEAIEIQTVSDKYDLGISYKTHVENQGWQEAVSNGALSGSQGQGLRLEAIEIELTGSDADLFDVYYQVQAQNIGWLDYAKNGQAAGSEGFGYRLEGIRIQVLPKGTAVPGEMTQSFLSNI